MLINRQKFAKLLEQLIFVLINLLFFATSFIFTWMNQELFEFSKMLFVYMVTVILVVLWSLRMLAEQKIIFKKSKLDPFILIFLLSQIIATIFSIHPRTSWFGYYTRFNGGLLSTMTYIALFYVLLANIKKNQIKSIINSLLLAMFLVSLYAIPEHFGHSPSCLIISQKFDASCWVQDVQNRVFATFGQPNWLATFLIAIIPLNIDRILKEKKWLNKFFLIILLFSGLAALVFSKSRSGLLGLGIAVGFYGLVKISKAQNYWQSFLRISSLALIISSLALIFITPHNRKLQEWFSLKSNVVAVGQMVQAGGTPSEEIRKIVWQGAIKVWQRYPIFGSGVETFAYSYYLDRPLAHNLVSEWDFLYNKAHNELLNTLANSGIFGLLSYLALFIAIFYLGKNSPDALSGIIAIFIANFFGFSTVMSNLLLFGLFAVVILEADESKNTKNIDKKRIDNKVNILTNEHYFYFLVMLIGLILLRKIWLIWHADYLFTQGQSSFEQGNYQVGLPLIQAAIKESPKEAFFYDELANDYSQLSIAFANEQQSSASTALAQSAIESNQYAIKLNPVHLNFYKSQARIYIRLGQLDQNLYAQAKKTLEKAITLAPTDAKLYYNLALVLEVLGEKENSLKNMEYAVSIKSNYLQARGELARMYTDRGEFLKAKEQYVYSLEKIAPDDELVREKLKIIEASLSGKIGL